MASDIDLDALEQKARAATADETTEEGRSRLLAEGIPCNMYSVSGCNEMAVAFDEDGHPWCRGHSPDLAGSRLDFRAWATKWTDGQLAKLRGPLAGGIASKLYDAFKRGARAERKLWRSRVDAAESRATRAEERLRVAVEALHIVSGCPHEEHRDECDSCIARAALAEVDDASPPGVVGGGG